MSKQDLSRACTAMEICCHRETPRFLVDKPLDVWMYTPELVALYTCSREVTSTMGKLAAELIKFEGDFLEMSSPDFEKAEHTPLTKSMDVTAGSQMFCWLDELLSTWIRLRAQTLRTQRLFWLGNHTTGANWDTVEQMLFRAAEDEGANICNPSFTPLSSWEEQVKAAIISARQENLCLAKDGKILLGQVLPRLLARHGKGAPGGKPGGAHCVLRTTSVCGDKIAASKRRARKAFGTGKENASGLSHTITPGLQLCYTAEFAKLRECLYSRSLGNP